MASTVYETDNCFGGASFFHLPVPLRYVTLRYTSASGILREPLQGVARLDIPFNQSSRDIHQPNGTYPASHPRACIQLSLNVLLASAFCFSKGVRRQNTPEVSLNFARGLRSDSWKLIYIFATTSLQADDCSPKDIWQTMTTWTEDRHEILHWTKELTKLVRWY